MRADRPPSSAVSLLIRQHPAGVEISAGYESERCRRADRGLNVADQVEDSTQYRYSKCEMAATVFCLRAGGKCTGDMFLLMPELRAARNKITIAQLVLLRKIPRKPSKMTG